jgi:hypothetical protein
VEAEVIRVLSCSLHVDELVLQLEVAGQRLHWQAVPRGRGFEHTLTTGPLRLLSARCGFSRFAQRAAELGMGEAWAWELVADLAWSAWQDRNEQQRALQEAWDQGYQEGQRSVVAAQRRRAQAVGCYLYLVQCGDRLKIGFSAQPSLRCRDLQTGSGAPVVLLKARLMRSRAVARRAEREAHRRFAEHRRHGEWFEDVPEIREFFGVS